MRNAELTFKELIVAILNRFWTILIIAVAGAALSGAFSVYTTQQKINASREDYDIRLAAHEQTLASKRSSISDTKAIAAQLREYNHNSLLMRVNPYDKQVASLSLSVEVEPDVFAVNSQDSKVLNFVELQETVINSILNRYTLLAAQADAHELLGDAAPQGTRDIYLRELISIDSRSGSIIILTAVAADGFDAQAAVQRMAEYLQGRKALVEESTVPHTIRLLQTGAQPVTDAGLAEYQNAKRSALADNAALLIRLQEEVNSLTANRPEAPSLAYSVVSAAVLGFLLGLVLATGIAILAYLVNLPAHYATQIERQLGIRFLGGAMPANKGIITRWKNGLAAEDLLTPRDGAAALMAANVAQAAAAGGKILLTGTLNADDLKQAAESLLRHVPAGTLDVFPVGELTTSAQAVRELAGADAVLIAERLYVSRLRQILGFKERAALSGKPVLGYILI